MQPPEMSETTRLLHPTQPHYVFGSITLRERKRRLRQFQCCVCSILLVMFACGLVITISYTINDEENSNTTDTNSTETAGIPVDQLLVLFAKKYNKTDNRTIDNQAYLKKAWEVGKRALEEKDKIEEKNPALKVSSPSFKHQRVLSTSARSRNLSRKGYQQEFAVRFLHGINNTEIYQLQKICLPNDSDTLPPYCTSLAQECNKFHKYRSYNGSCNNLKFPNLYGTTHVPFRRGLPPDYADGISKPRISKSKRPLPTARSVSLEVHRPYYRDDPKFSVMLAVWGQFLDHDITATALSQKANGSTISCCEDSSQSSPECFPVTIDKDDPFSEYNITCMEFVRSAPSPTCCLGPREQMNQVTPFIDGSVIYSADEEKAMTLRTLKGGELKMYVTEDNMTLLPVSEDMNDGCNREEEKENGRYCFLTGDDRANENLHLTSMHLIWARHHNNLARNLTKINRHWDDETTFQEARRILASQMQHITYNEFLPILLGGKIMKKFDLKPQNQGYFKKYNDSIDPNIANEFATASFRFAHTIIPGLMKLLVNDTSSPEYVQMHKMLFDPFKLYQQGELEKTIRGAMNTSIEASDSYFSNELKSHLFERSENMTSTNEPTRKCGLDLVSLNIQRGRDHGLSGYIYWREYCGLSKIEKFRDLKNVMDREPLENIQAIYRQVEDIDLYTGGVSEKPIKGSILGPTFTCLILDQFMRVKYGDRFWYENSQHPQAFSKDQLNEIRKTTLANVICDNTDNLDYIQPRVMERSSKKNSQTSCFELPRVNLTFWKEKFDEKSPVSNVFVVQH